MSHVRKFRKLLTEPGIIVAAGAYDVLSAKIAVNLGFPAIYLGSWATTTSMLGMTDTSYFSLTEMSTFTRNVHNAIGDTPIITDIDKGFGNLITARRAIWEAEAAGAAAVHLEDDEFGKHTRQERILTPLPVMLDKLKAAMEARKNKDFVIIGRTDSRGADLMDRVKAYDSIGVDVIMAGGIEPKDYPKLRKAGISTPMLTVYQLARGYTVKQLEELGCKIVLFFGQALLVSHKAVTEYWQEVKRSGSDAAMKDRMSTMEELDQFLGIREIEKLAEKYKIAH